MDLEPSKGMGGQRGVLWPFNTSGCGLAGGEKKQPLKSLPNPFLCST